MEGGIIMNKDYDSSAKKFKLLFDISSEGEAQYEELCPLNLDYDQGETLDTWNDLCSQIANNVKTALDPTWSTGFKFAKSDPVAQFILSKEHAVGVEATAKTRIVNLLKGATGKQIDFTATLSGITYSAVSEEVLQIDFDIKVYDGSTFKETDYTPE